MHKTDADPDAADTTTTAVRDHVLSALGRPPLPYKVQVTRLWENAYRANVFVGAADEVRIAHSFFVETSAAGEVVASVPPLTRVYA